MKTILLVEDEEHDVLFMKLAMEHAKIDNPLIVVTDGHQAMNYFEGRRPYDDRRKYPIPGLVLLDLKLPYLPGLEVLKLVRANPAFANIPIIVFSSSNQDQDVRSAYALGANGYVVKPAYTELLEVVERVKRYWLEMDGPPPNCPEWLSISEPKPPSA